MRWIAGVVALVFTMHGLRIVTASAPLEARTTIALGLLLLAAALGSAIALRLGLPRITGYLLAGALIGPAGREYVQADEVRALGVVLDAAGALIALAIGGELRRDLLTRDARVIGRGTLGALVLPLVLVTLFVLLMGSWFPITAVQPLGDRLIVGLVLGTIAAASSPFVVKAVIDETHARSLFARQLLALTAFKDAAVVLVLALVLAAGSRFTSLGTMAPGTAWRPAIVFVGSIGLGVAGGWIAAQYLRTIRRHAPLFLLALGFGAGYVTRVLDLEVLLAGLAAGCFLVNAAPAESEGLWRVLRRSALPLYALAFVLLGAGLRPGGLGGLWEVWPWVLAIALLRAFGLHYGLRWAGRDVGVSPALARHGWLGLVSQGGITLGLAALVRRAFPEWGVSLEGFVLGMIGVHETVGPVMFRWGVVRTGEGIEEVRREESVASERLAVVSRPGGGL